MGFAQTTFSPNVRRMPLCQVQTDSDIARVAELGQRIWTEHYTPILAEGQVPYMLEHVHSAAIIRSEITTGGYNYHLIKDGTGEAVGYLGFVNEGDAIFLSKVYLLASARGTGLGREALDFVRLCAEELGCRTIRLGVNKGNASAIAAYQRVGFRITGEMVNDIGGGFVMDDYAMEWAI